MQMKIKKRWIKIMNPHNEIAKYFKGIVLTKIRNEIIRMKPMSTYAAVIEAMMIGRKRYIIAMVPDDGVPLGTEVPLPFVRWVSFQTRTIEDIENFTRFALRPQSYPRVKDDTLLRVKE